MLLSFHEILAAVCEAAGVAMVNAHQTLEACGLITPQARNLFRARLRQKLASQGLHAANAQIPVDDDVTLRGIAQTIEGSAMAPIDEAVPFRFGGSSTAHEAHNYAVRRVFYATDRSVLGLGTEHLAFGPERGDGSLTLGTCEVSIPRDHRMAALESPSIWRLEFRNDPEKHVVLLKTEQLEESAFYADVRSGLGDESSAFVFVHGYHVSFEDAARRTGQLAYDLQFGGASIFYSWPSFDSLPSYSADEAAVEWSAPHLRQFLQTFHAKTGAQRVHLIAHSMGNRALTRALESLGAGTSAPLFQQIVLTAPDIDKGVFLQLADNIKKAGGRVTLYASTKDMALGASGWLHRGARAGESGEDIVVVEGIDTVDASAVDASLLGHSYFGGSRSVVGDLFTLLRKGDAPGSRFGLTPVKLGQREYWRFLA